MVGNGNILPDSEKAAKVANCLSDMHYKIMIPLEINIWLEDRLTSQIVLHDMQNNLHVYNSTLWIFFFNDEAYLNLKLPQRTIPLLHRDGSQQQFSTVKYSSTTPLNSTSSPGWNTGDFGHGNEHLQNLSDTQKGKSAGVDGVR